MNKILMNKIFDQLVSSVLLMLRYYSTWPITNITFQNYLIPFFLLSSQPSFLNTILLGCCCSCCSCCSWCWWCCGCCWCFSSCCCKAGLDSLSFILQLSQVTLLLVTAAWWRISEYYISSQSQPVTTASLNSKQKPPDLENEACTGWQCSALLRINYCLNDWDHLI